MTIIAVPIDRSAPEYFSGILARKIMSEQYSISMKILDILCQLSPERNTYWRASLSYILKARSARYIKKHVAATPVNTMSLPRSSWVFASATITARKEQAVMTVQRNTIHDSSSENLWFMIISSVASPIILLSLVGKRPLPHLGFD